MGVEGSKVRGGFFHGGFREEKRGRKGVEVEKKRGAWRRLHAGSHQVRVINFVSTRALVDAISFT